MFDCLVISGGATKGHIACSILSRHEKDLKDIHTYIGTSVGAVLCTLLCTGATPDEMIKIGMETHCQTPTGVQWISSIGSFFTKLGLMDRNTYLDVVSKYITERYGMIPTMSELYDMTKKNLMICATALISRRRVVFSHTTHPNLPILDALHMSIRMPLIFTPIYFDNDLYVDGGVRSHFPIDLRSGRTLAIHTYNKVRDISSILRSPSITEYIGLLISCASPPDIPRTMNGILYDVPYEKKNMTSVEEAHHMIDVGKKVVPIIHN